MKQTQIQLDKELTT